MSNDIIAEYEKHLEFTLCAVVRPNWWGTFRFLAREAYM